MMLIIWNIHLLDDKLEINVIPKLFQNRENPKRMELQPTNLQFESILYWQFFLMIFDFYNESHYCVFIFSLWAHTFV